jgi:hypothetical protein
MALLKSLHSADPDVIQNLDLQVPDIQCVSLVSATRVKAVKKLITYQPTFELALKVLVHVRWPHTLWQPCRGFE